MNIFSHKLPEEHRSIILVPLADSHIGDPNFVEPLFKEYIRWIAETPNAYTILNGDICNLPTRISPSDLFDQEYTPQKSLDKARILLAPLKGKVLGVVDGTHESRIQKFCGLFPGAVLAEQLSTKEVPSYYTPDGLYLKLYFGSTGYQQHCFFVYATHGWVNARKMGGVVLSLEELAYAIHADVYITSHSHRMEVHKLNYMMPSHKGRQLLPFPKTLISTGAFLAYGKGYAIKKGYQAPHPGTVKIELKRIDNTKRVEILLT